MAPARRPGTPPALTIEAAAAYELLLSVVAAFDTDDAVYRSQALAQGPKGATNVDSSVVEYELECTRSYEPALLRTSRCPSFPRAIEPRRGTRIGIASKPLN